MVTPIRIASRVVGEGHPCFVIGEAGVNHNGDLAMALELVRAAAGAGVDAIKFQLFRAEEQSSASAPTADYQEAHTGSTTMVEMARSYDLPWDAHKEIAACCAEHGIHYMASCFDSQAVDFYLEIGGPAIKVGSGEITNFPLLAYMARTGNPVLLSTGMSELADVREAVAHLRSEGCTSLALFHCVSNYPTKPDQVNLRVMRTLQTEFETPVGFSDHTSTNSVALAAVAMGADLIEKHITLDRDLPGPDHAMSLDPAMLKDFVNGIRDTESALGSCEKRLQPGEREVQQVARRSLVSTREIQKGEVLNDENVTLKRPATGIDPRRWEEVRGKATLTDIDADVPIRWDMVE